MQHEPVHYMISKYIASGHTCQRRQNPPGVVRRADSHNREVGARSQEIRLPGTTPRLPLCWADLASASAQPWYFLRVLWAEDGLSQRELSARVGTMEPTTVIALRSMERAGLIRRVRSARDKRKAQVWLTPKAKRMRDELLVVARGITDEAEHGIGRTELAKFRRVVARMTANLDQITD
jgi:DNA-binding MarR family transcriptional regulator